MVNMKYVLKIHTILQIVGCFISIDDPLSLKNALTPYARLPILKSFQESTYYPHESNPLGPIYIPTHTPIHSRTGIRRLRFGFGLSFYHACALRIHFVYMHTHKHLQKCRTSAGLRARSTLRCLAAFSDALR